MIRGSFARPARAAGALLASALLASAAAVVLAGGSSHQASAAGKRTCAYTTAADPALDRLQLAFSDEFNGSELDRTRWGTTMLFAGAAGGHYHNTSYGSYAVDENIRIGGGRLRLITDDEPIQGTDPPGWYRYTEGFMSSADKFSQAYGRWEVCAKFPAGKGLWPAFWTAPQDRSWPPEWDIAEWFGSIDGMQQGLATGAWPNVNWNSAWTYSTTPTRGWHTYTLDWRPNRALFLVDGRLTHEINGSYVPSKEMYVILNSGTWARSDRGGPPDRTTRFPNAFEVDYVRVYR